MTRVVIVVAVAIAIGGCGLPVIQKRSYNSMSTALFKRPCGRVFKRIIEGGFVNNPKQERALLVCPGSFLTDVLTGQVTGAVKAFSPVK